MIRDVLLVILAVVACYTDIREQKIKNILTGPMMLIGDRKSTRLNSSHLARSRIPSSA